MPTTKGIIKIRDRKGERFCKLQYSLTSSKLRPRPCPHGRMYNNNLYPSCTLIPNLFLILCRALAGTAHGKGSKGRGGEGRIRGWTVTEPSCIFVAALVTGIKNISCVGKGGGCAPAAAAKPTSRCAGFGGNLEGIGHDARWSRCLSAVVSHGTYTYTWRIYDPRRCVTALAV